MIRHLLQGNPTPQVLLASLEGHSARQRAIVNNIANVDTPGYRRIEVSFEEKLQREVEGLRNRRSHGGMERGERETVLASFAPEVSTDMKSPIRFDGSNVQIDREMVDLAKTTGKINELTELLIRQFKMTRSAIVGRNL